MFYSPELLGRRGRLGTLWLAGHLRRVSKPAVIAANISVLCSIVENSDVPLALPVQSTLLRGVVHIENKKTIYLLEQAIEAKTAAAEIDRMRTTGEANRIKARSDLITMTESSGLPFDQFAPFSLEGESRGFETSQDRLAIDLSVQAALYAGRSTLSTARAEDITLTGSSWTLESQIASESFELALAQEELRGEVFDLDEPMLGVEEKREEEMFVEPMPEIAEAATETSTAVVSEERARRQRKRKGPKGIFKHQIDEELELSDSAIRASLSDTGSIVYYRPGLVFPLVAEFSIIDIVNRPAGIDLRDQKNLPDLLTAFNAQRLEPVIIEPSTEETRAAFGGLVTDESWVSDMAIEAESMAEVEAAIRAPEEFMEYEEGVGGRIDEYQPTAAELTDILSMRSFLGRSLDQSAIEAERSARASLEAEEISMRRESGFGISASFLTPEVEVPTSQFVLPHIVHATPPRDVREIRGLSPITSMFLAEVDAKFSELESMGGELRIEFDSLLEEVVGSMRIIRRDRALSFFSLLILESAGILHCEQIETNAPIFLMKGMNYDRREKSGSEAF